MRSYKLFALYLLVVALFVWGCQNDTPVSQKEIESEMISDNVIYTNIGEPFTYHIEYHTNSEIDVIQYPPWLTVEADSIFGEIPFNFKDSTFIIVISDGYFADTITALVYKNPVMIAYGDSRTGHAMHQKVVDLMEIFRPAIVVHSGDLVNNGLSSADWDTFMSITAELRAMTDFYPALGNHENQADYFFSNFDLPNNEQWYSVDKNYIHFIILNSCVPINSTSEQYQWLQQDLANVADSMKFIAVVFHHPPYSTGPHTEDEKGLRDKIVPLFQQYGVDIVLNGHDHHYERSNCGGIYYVVTGGGGAPLRDQSRDHPCSQLYLTEHHFCKMVIVGNTLKVRVYNDDAELIDQFEIEK